MPSLPSIEQQARLNVSLYSKWYMGSIHAHHLILLPFPLLSSLVGSREEGERDTKSSMPMQGQELRSSMSKIRFKPTSIAKMLSSNPGILFGFIYGRSDFLAREGPSFSLGYMGLLKS